MAFGEKATNLLVPFLLLAAGTASSQNQKAADQNSGAVTFTSRAEMVLVPVVVSDKSGNHIPGLTKDSFELQEDGKSRPIAALEEIKTFTSRAARSASQPGVYTNALSGGSSPKRLTIFALDLVNTPFLDQTYAREQLVKYLASTIGSQEPIAVVAIRSNGMQVLHDFSTDPAVLVAALQQAKGQASELRHPSPNESGAAVNTLPIMSSSSQPFNASQINGETQALASFLVGGDKRVEFATEEQSILVTLQAFQHVAEAFAGIPGRKSLIWATAAFPFGLDARSGEMFAPQLNRTSELTMLEPTFERTLQMLNNANVAVYPVDARGMVVFFPGADVSQIQGLNSYNASLFESSRETMVSFADMTGGKAFYNRNDLDKAFAKAADDSATYYMLSYYLDKNAKPGWHKLHVKLKNAAGEVRARSGFFVTAQAKQEDTQRMDVSLALVSPLDYTALPLSVRWTGVKADGGKKKVRFEIDLAPDSNIVDATRNGLLDIEVVVAARTAEGKPADQFSQSVKSNLKPDALHEVLTNGLNYNNDLILTAGEYSVRFVVRDNLTGRLGSVIAPLQVTP